MTVSFTSAHSTSHLILVHATNKGYGGLVSFNPMGCEESVIRYMQKKLRIYIYIYTHGWSWRLAQWPHVASIGIRIRAITKPNQEDRRRRRRPFIQYHPWVRRVHQSPVAWGQERIYIFIYAVDLLSSGLLCTQHSSTNPLGSCSGCLLDRVLLSEKKIYQMHYFFFE